MLEAIDLTKRGVTVDIDTYEEDLHRWVQFFLDHGGNIGMLTVSTDAAINSPGTLFEQIMKCVQLGMKLERLLPCVTTNTARVLKLKGKGRLAVEMDADVVLFSAADHGIKHVIAGGKHLLNNGRLNVTENFLKQSNRSIAIHGKS